MPSDKKINTIGRYRINLPDKYLTLLEATHDHVRIRKTPYSRFTFRGVPGRKADIIVADSIMEHRRNTNIIIEVSNQIPQKLAPAVQDVVLELGEKAGRYDNQIRRRYAIRPWPQNTIGDIPRADLRIVVDSEDKLIIIIRPETGTPTIDEYQMLRSNLDSYDLSRIIGWHWRRFFTHLTDQDEVRGFADSWEVEVRLTGEAASWTLAEANRAASRALYRLSRKLGWRKMTLRERLAYGLTADSPCWQRESDFIGRICANEDLSAPLTEWEILEMEFEE